jgi:ketosteroid isomerase-like protein
MDDQDNIQSLKTLHAAFIRGDIHSVLGFFSDGLDFQHPMPQSIWPWAGKRRGRMGLAEFIEGLNPLIEYEQFEPREYCSGRPGRGSLFRARTHQSHPGHLRQLLRACI